MKLIDRIYIFGAKFCTFFTKSVYLLFAVFFAISIILSFITYAVSRPEPIFLQNNLLFTAGLIICIFLTLGVLFLLYKLNNKLKNISLKKFQLIILSLFIIVQVAFVLLFPVNARSDCRKVFEVALELLNGNTKSFEPGNYLSFYPNNIGITLYLTAIYYIFPYTLLIPRFFNIIFTTITVIYCAKLLIQLTHADQKLYRFALMILAIAPVPIIMNNYVYGDVPSTSLCVMGLYYGVLYHKNRRFRTLALSALFLIIGYFLRCSGVFFAAALALYFIIHGFWDKTFLKKAFIAVVVMIIVSLNLPYQLFDIIGNQTGYLKQSINAQSQPVIRWINMGFPSNDSLGYWDNGHATKVFHDICKDDKAKASKILTAEFMSKIKTTPIQKTLLGYGKKTYWLWTEGTYQANFYPLTIPNKPEYKMLYDTPFKPMLKNPRSKLRIGLIGLLYGQNLLLLALLALYCVYALRRKRHEMLLPTLVIFIFFVFYIFWEIKSRYIYGSYFMLAIIAIFMLNLIFQKITSKNIFPYKNFTIKKI